MSLLVSLFAGLRLLRLEPGTQTLPTLVYLVPFRRGACCPLCQRLSRRVHSRYWRTLADLPYAEQSACLKVQVRRFFCGDRRCTRRIFAERLPDLTQPYSGPICQDIFLPSLRWSACRVGAAHLPHVSW